MFRVRIPLVAAAVVAVLTFVIYGTVSSLLGGVASQTITAQVEHAQSSFLPLDRVRGIESANRAAELARDDEFGQIFEKSEELERRKAASVAVDGRNARLAQEGRKADLVAVVDANGKVVCRDLNIEAMYGDDLASKYPSVKKALDGVANKDVWSFQEKMFRVASAPIRAKSGSVVGALVIGYVSSAKDAGDDKEKLGSEVAYFLDNKVQASSFSKGGGESAEEKALGKQLFEDSKLAAPVLEGRKTEPFRIKIGGEEYIAAAGPLPGNATPSKSGYVVLASLTAAQAVTAGVAMWILMLGGISLGAVLAAALLTGRRFITPLDRIEGGVAEVINGNRDYSFESPSADFEGLANGLNVMLARLLGRPDPTDDDLGGSTEGNRWQGEIAVEDVSTTGHNASPENVALAAEPEEEYLRRVFNEYVAARTQTGEGVDGLAQEGFVAKLRQNENALKKKYACSAVRFKVVIKSNQTTLKPVPIP